ncbi:DUF916 and DUF3324 domain-containing protein [Dellaglioa sp. BT-FLS60]
MKLRKLFLSVLAILTFTIVTVSTNVYAKSEGAGFTVTKVTPTNQYRAASQFDIKVTPNSTQTLSLNIKNLENDTKTIIISPNNSYTNTNGLIVYDKPTVKKPAMAKYQFSDLVSKKQEVVVGPKKTTTATFTVKTPATAFSGIVLGGFNVQEKVIKEKSEKKGLTITNRFAYVIQAVIRESKTAENPGPKLTIGFSKVTLNAFKHVSLQTNFQNDVPIVIGPTTIKATITAKGSSKVLYRKNIKKVDFAPYANFSYALDLTKSDLKAGDYNVHYVATGNGKSWQTTNPFTITKADIKRIKKETKTQVNWLLWLIIGIIVFLILLVLFLLFIIFKRRKKDEDETLEK